MVQDIVLIDDDWEDLEMIEESIRGINPLVHCQSFLNAGEAIRILKAEPSSPDVIIIDFRMPEMSGLDCLAQLRELEKLKDVLFVVYSSVDLPDNILGNISEQGVVVFQKPSSFDELNKIMSRLMIR